MPDNRWVMGSTAAQDTYGDQWVEDKPPIYPVATPVAPAATFDERFAGAPAPEVRPPAPREPENVYKTASKLVNITQKDVDKAIRMALTINPRPVRRPK